MEKINKYCIDSAKANLQKQKIIVTLVHNNFQSRQGWRQEFSDENDINDEDNYMLYCKRAFTDDLRGCYVKNVSRRKPTDPYHLAKEYLRRKTILAHLCNWVWLSSSAMSAELHRTHHAHSAGHTHV